MHVAPQSVDNDFWRSPDDRAAERSRGGPPRPTSRFLFVGRPGREKGLQVLLEAWRASRPGAARGALVLAGVGSSAVSLGAARRRSRARGRRAAARASSSASTPLAAACELRDLYAACDVLVVPSIPTRTFREPWGLVVNEAMNQGLAVIATDAVGAAAGGLVRDGRNGLVVPAGDSRALARRHRAARAATRQLRARMGAAGASDVLRLQPRRLGGGLLARAVQPRPLPQRVGSVDAVSL